MFNNAPGSELGQPRTSSLPGGPFTGAPFSTTLMNWDLGRLHNAVSRLGFKSYKNYLESEHWKALQKEFFHCQQSDSKCYICQNVRSLHLHHLTYARLGSELLSDLVGLCSVCHSDVHSHKSFNRSTVELLRKQFQRRPAKALVQQAVRVQQFKAKQEWKRQQREARKESTFYVPAG